MLMIRIDQRPGHAFDKSKRLHRLLREQHSTVVELRHPSGMSMRTMKDECSRTTNMINPSINSCTGRVINSILYRFEYNYDVTDVGLCEFRFDVRTGTRCG